MTVTGDRGGIALFRTPENATLNLVVYQQPGACRVAEATVTALLLLSCPACLWLLQIRVGKSRHE